MAEAAGTVEFTPVTPMARTPLVDHAEAVVRPLEVLSVDASVEPAFHHHLNRFVFERTAS